MLSDIAIKVVFAYQCETAHLIPRELRIVAQRLHIVNGGTEVGRSILTSKPDLCDGLSLGYCENWVFHDLMLCSSGYAHDAALTVAGSGIVAPSNGTDVACGGCDGHQFLDGELV